MKAPEGGLRPPSAITGLKGWRLKDDTIRGIFFRKNAVMNFHPENPGPRGET